MDEIEIVNFNVKANKTLMKPGLSVFLVRTPFQKDQNDGLTLSRMTE
jgi:hypothetical protein